MSDLELEKSVKRLTLRVA